MNEEDELKNQLGNRDTEGDFDDDTQIEDDDFLLALETDLPNSADDDYETENVTPKQDEEFTCASCFLVFHKNQIGRIDGDDIYCQDCA